METVEQKTAMLELAEEYVLNKNNRKFKAFPSNSLEAVSNSGYPLEVESPQYSIYTTLREISKNGIIIKDKFTDVFGVNYEVLSIIPDDMGWAILRIKRTSQTTIPKAVVTI